MNGFTSGTQALQGRKVNHDPAPWAYSRLAIDNDDGPFGHNDRAASRIDGAMMWFPRPEYDVLDNPILAAFRDWRRIAADWEDVSDTAQEWLDYARCVPRFEGESFKLYWAARKVATPEQVKHARRVLTKLAALASTKEQP